MFEVVEVTAREPIERFVRRDLPLHIYELGDLDPFFWPKTRWFGLRGSDGELAALSLLYAALQVPALLALGRDDGGAIAELVGRIAPKLPPHVYAHISSGVAAKLEGSWTLEGHGHLLKMVLRAPEAVADVDDTDIVALGDGDFAALQKLYARAYPDNWFDPRMLQTGQYFGVRKADTLVCAAGIHVYSPEYGVAALGNVTTDPAHRGQGLARRTVARVCRQLLQQVETIGLNVHDDNAAAIACYERLGFVAEAEYDEVMATRV